MDDSSGYLGVHAAGLELTARRLVGTMLVAAIRAAATKPLLVRPLTRIDEFDAATLALHRVDVFEV